MGPRYKYAPGVEMWVYQHVKNPRAACDTVICLIVMLFTEFLDFARPVINYLTNA